MSKYDKYFNENITGKQALNMFCRLVDKDMSDEEKLDLDKAYRKVDKIIFKKELQDVTDDYVMID
jgi:hypothetical protein